MWRMQRLFNALGCYLLPWVYWFIGDFHLDNVSKGMLPLLLTGEPHVQNLSYDTLSTTFRSGDDHDENCQHGDKSFASR